MKYLSTQKKETVSRYQEETRQARHCFLSKQKVGYFANMRHIKNNVTLVTTTKEKMEGYTKKACERAELA